MFRKILLNFDIYLYPNTHTHTHMKQTFYLGKDKYEYKMQHQSGNYF
jgi:hypothetical protein